MFAKAVLCAKTVRARAAALAIGTAALWTLGAASAGAPAQASAHANAPAVKYSKSDVLRAFKAVGDALYDTGYTAIASPIAVLATVKPYQGWNAAVYIYPTTSEAAASFRGNAKKWRTDGVAATELENLVVTVVSKSSAVAPTVPLRTMPALVVKALASLPHQGRSLASALGVSSGPKKISGLGISPKMVVTPNWSGYVASAPAKSSPAHPYFTSATGTWTVPTAHCARAKGKASSTVWVGLGGFATRDQEEVGTDSNCSAKGKGVYYAWFELVPYPSYRAFPDIKDKVSPGDTITGLVKILKPTLVELRVQDRTRGWTFMRKITFSSQDTSTADWVVETPAECVGYYCHEANLANFAAVTMRNVSAVGKGSTGTLRDPHWKVIPVRLVPSKLLVPTLLPGPNAANSSTPVRKGRAQSPAGATPGSVSHDGKSFSVKWIAVATRGV